MFPNYGYQWLIESHIFSAYFWATLLLRSLCSSGSKSRNIYIRFSVPTEGSRHLVSVLSTMFCCTPLPTSNLFGTKDIASLLFSAHVVMIGTTTPNMSKPHKVNFATQPYHALQIIANVGRLELQNFTKLNSRYTGAALPLSRFGFQQQDASGLPSRWA